MRRTVAVRSLAQGWRAATAFDGAGFDAEESSMLFPDARMDPPPPVQMVPAPEDAEDADDAEDVDDADDELTPMTGDWRFDR